MGSEGVNSPPAPQGFRRFSQRTIASATACGSSGTNAWPAPGITTTDTRSPNSSRISLRAVSYTHLTLPTSDLV